MVHPFLEGVGITPSIGGKSLVSYQLTSWLLNHGHEVAIFPLKERLGQDCVFRIGVEKAKVFASRPLSQNLSLFKIILRHFFKMKRIQGLRGIVESARMLAGLRRAVEELRPDLIHVQYTRSSFPALYSIGFSSIPAVLTHYHGQGNGLDKYSGIVFPSKTQSRDTKKAKLFPAVSSKVIHLPVEKGYLEAEYIPLSKRVREILFVGRLYDNRKGLDLLLQAYGFGVELPPLTVVGDGPLHDSYVRLAAEKGVNARFLGNVGEGRLIELMMNCRMLVTPSRWESFGVVYAESACCGTPCIGYAPTVQELNETLEHPIGIPYDTTEGAESLLRAIQSGLDGGRFDENWSEKISRQARAYFRVESYGAAYLEFYKGILEDNVRDSASTSQYRDNS